jgi:hypothetical protein
MRTSSALLSLDFYLVMSTVWSQLIIRQRSTFRLSTCSSRGTTAPCSRYIALFTNKYIETSTHNQNNNNNNKALLHDMVHESALTRADLVFRDFRGAGRREDAADAAGRARFSRQNYPHHSHDLQTRYTHSLSLSYDSSQTLTHRTPIPL